MHATSFDNNTAISPSSFHTPSPNNNTIISLHFFQDTRSTIVILALDCKNDRSDTMGQETIYPMYGFRVGAGVVVWVPGNI